jgi:hypothetical protein
MPRMGRRVRSSVHAGPTQWSGRGDVTVVALRSRSPAAWSRGMDGPRG